MSGWIWLLIGFGAGLLAIGIPVLVWIVRYVRDWDRAWGFR